MWRSAPCSSPVLQCAQSTSPSLLHVPFQFLVYYSVFACVWGQSVQGLCLFIPGVAVGILHSTYLLTCFSATPKQVWSQHLAAWEPSCFLSVMWHGEALYRLEFQSVIFLILLGGFFCQVWLQRLSKIFYLRCSHCLFLLSSHHLGSSFYFNSNSLFPYLEGELFSQTLIY
jgi:hypothetical protein